MRMPSLAVDGWELESGEARRAEVGSSFWLPRRDVREALGVGQAAKLLFRLEAEEDDGTVGVQVERMWVLVARRLDDGTYVGILENEPVSVEPGPGAYLAPGVEVPFGPDHVIDVDDPPPDHVKARLATPPTARWPDD